MDSSEELPKKKLRKEKSKDFDITYKIIYEGKEVDLDLNLNNPIEDRFFAYSLTLIDLFQTLEEFEKHSPPEMVEDFMTAIKVVKSMAEAVKMKLEIRAGLVTEEEVFAKKLNDEKLSPENKARLKRLIDELKKRKRQESSNEFSLSEGIPVESIKIDTTGLSEDEVKDLIKKKMEGVLSKIAREISGNSEQKESEKNENEEPKEDKPSFIKSKPVREKPADDLEM
jgi:hypothetical protein